MLQWPWRRFTNGSSDFVVVVNRLRRGEIGTSFNVKNPRECWKSKWNDSIKEAIDSREISEDLNIDYGSVQNILTTDLNMRRVSVKFVPRVLTLEQKQQLLSISLELRDRPSSDSSFSGNFITGDETWVYGYDPETRVQSCQWKSPSSPRAN